MRRYVADEITVIRRDAGEEVTSDTTDLTEGVNRETILEYMRDADSLMQETLLESLPNLTLFDKRSEISLLADTQEYDLPGDVYLDGQVKRVEYSHNGEARNYEIIHPVDYGEVDNYPGDYQHGWTILGSKLLLSVNSSGQGKVRIVYPRQTDLLDFRRGKIAQVFTEGDNYSDITLENDSWLEESMFDSNSYLTVVDQKGAAKYYNVPYDTYNQSNRAFDLTSGVATSGGTIAAGDYICLGPYSTTHSALPRQCTKHRILYATLRLKAKRSSQDFNENSAILTQARDQAVNAFSQRTPAPYFIDEGATY